MNTNIKKILVVRNDKLGDFMLSWPALATLKNALPQCEIHALVNEYTAEMANLCPFIDHPVVDPGPDAKNSIQASFVKMLRQQHYDAAITLFSTSRIGIILLAAGIPYRLAPATKIAQIFYHKRLKQRRSRSEKPEYGYNQDLALHFLSDLGVEPGLQTTPPYLSFEQNIVDETRRSFCLKHSIPEDRNLIFIHPGSGGSANNLNQDQYALLASQLQSSRQHHIIISAGPSEVEYAQALADLLPDTPHTLYPSTAGLKLFAQHIACADLFISGSTGPLHIAGALNRPTAAFYTRRRSATALRWQTTNSEDRRLAFTPPDDAEVEDMSKVDIFAAAEEISRHFLLD